MQKSRSTAYKITDLTQLEQAEKLYRMENADELLPFANNTSYKELAESIIPDRDGSWKNELYIIVNKHRSTLGLRTICQDMNNFLTEVKSQGYLLDILSINSRIDKNQIILTTLIRLYQEFDVTVFSKFYDYVEDNLFEEEQEEDNLPVSGLLVKPDNYDELLTSQSDEDIRTKNLKIQDKILNSSDIQHPFLNSIEHYVPKTIPNPEDVADMIYDLQTSDMKIQTLSSYEDFNKVFREIMTFVNGTEIYHYKRVIAGQDNESPEMFMSFLEAHIQTEYVRYNKLPVEDVHVLLKKLYRSLFQLYVVQDLVDDPHVTDIKITAPDAIRARIDGKAYISNITFIDEMDYQRFIDMIAIRNHISLNVPSQTFTDTRDENYIMRFSITAAYVNSVPWPYLHIRKINRKKLMAPELIEMDFMDEKIRDYLLDIGKTSRGVVFAGPPGSGKTVCLNWFIEDAFLQTKEMLVIQENDELFCYRKGVMFQHVVNYAENNELPVSLEQLGQLALVAGANIFVIGEAKGAEICSAITLSNSGCQTAITIHSPSSTETIDKMADLAMRGFAQDYDQAKRMLKSFQTIVYMEDFQITEISEIVGYDEEKHDMIYRYIYRRPESEKRKNKRKQETK